MKLPISLISCDSDPLSEADVARIEAAIGRLPDDYREFLLRSNGGRVSHDKVFLSSGDGEENVIHISSFTVIEPRFPPAVVTATLGGAEQHLIAVADCYDSPLLMSLDGPNPGAIHFWEYELEALWDAEENGLEYLPQDHTVTLVAKSFQGLADRLVAVDEHTVPTLDDMERSVVNFAKYGDHFFPHTKRFFDSLTLEQLNEAWPKNGQYPYAPIHFSANWSQVKTTKYLIDRGVDIDGAVACCTNSCAITQLLIDAGATELGLRQHLLSASAGLAATRLPEEHMKIIELLVDRGVQPDFNEPQEHRDWMQAMDQIYGKKILRYLMERIVFPDDIVEKIRSRLDRPASGLT